MSWRCAGGTASDATLSVLLSVSVTHDGLAPIARRYVEAELARYAALLAAHPPDACVLGIGENGHVLVHPGQDPATGIDLKALVDELGVRGLTPPILLRQVLPQPTGRHPTEALCLHC